MEPVACMQTSVERLDPGPARRAGAGRRAQRRGHDRPDQGAPEGHAGFLGVLGFRCHVWGHVQCRRTQLYHQFNLQPGHGHCMHAQRRPTSSLRAPKLQPRRQPQTNQHTNQPTYRRLHARAHARMCAGGGCPGARERLAVHVHAHAGGDGQRARAQGGGYGGRSV
jgi:hypothetical protein